MPRPPRLRATAPGATSAPARVEELSLAGRLASRLSGETRQPLSVLRNVAYFLNLHLGESLDDKTRHHLALLLRSVEDLDGLVTNLAALTGVNHAVRQTADVRVLVDAALGRVHTRPGVTVETALAPEAALFCDPVQVRQALTNVIQNSVEAMPAHGRIRIVCRNVGPETRVTIADNGLGMSDEVRARVFEPFFTTASHRVGIGLTAALRLVGASGGTVGIESTPGVGTTVTLTFPRHDGP